MKLTKVFILLFILSGFFHGVCLSDTEEAFPKIAFVKNDGANVRAGDNINFEALWLLNAYFSFMISDTSSSRKKNALLSVNAPF